MKRFSTLAAGLLIGAAALQFSNVAFGQSDGWVTKHAAGHVALQYGSGVLKWRKVQIKAL